MLRTQKFAKQVVGCPATFQLRRMQMLSMCRKFSSVTSKIEASTNDSANTKLLLAERAVSDRLLRALAPTTMRFKNEIAGYASVRLIGDSSEAHGRFRYWTSTPHGQAQAVYYRCKLSAAAGASALEAGTEIVLDLNRLSSEFGRPVALRSMAISPDSDHSILLAVVDTEGDDRPQLLIRPIGNGIVSERLADGRRRRRKRPFDAETLSDVGGAVWLPAQPGQPASLLYTRLDDTLRSFCVRRRTLPYAWPGPSSAACPPHRAGHAAAIAQPFELAKDELIFTMPPGLDDAAQASIIVSKDGAFASINLNSREGTAAVLIYDRSFCAGSHMDGIPGVSDAAGPAPCETPSQPSGRLILIRPPMVQSGAAAAAVDAGLAQTAPSGLQYFLAHAQGHLLMVTNAGGAENYCILRAPLSNALAAARPASSASAVKLQTEPQDDHRDGLPLWEVPADALTWSPLVPHRSNVHIDDVEVCGGGRWLLVYEAVDDLPRLLVVPISKADSTAAPASGADSSTSVYPSALPAGSFYVPLPAGTVEIAGAINADAGSAVFRFSAVFATRPACEFSIDLDAAAADVPRGGAGAAASSAAAPTARQGHLRTVVQRIAGTAPDRPLFATDTLTSYRLQAPSWDGTSVPVTLTHRADLGIDAAAAQDLCRRLCEASTRWYAAAASPAVSRGPLSSWSGSTSLDSSVAPPVSPVAVALALACEGWDDWRFETGSPILTQERAGASQAPGSQATSMYPLLSGRPGMEACGFHGPLPPHLSAADVKRIAQVCSSGQERALPLSRITRFLDAVEATAGSTSGSGSSDAAAAWAAGLATVSDSSSPNVSASSRGGLFSGLSSLLQLADRKAPVDTHRRVLAAEEPLSQSLPVLVPERARGTHSKRSRRERPSESVDHEAPEALSAFLRELAVSDSDDAHQPSHGGPASGHEAGKATAKLAMAGSPPFACPRSYERSCGNPALLQLYGAYGHTLSTAYDPSLLPLLTRGWVAAFAHVRGGGEGGMRRWYEAGRGRRKHNGAHDAVAAVRTLIATGLTRSRWLALRSESAGGVLGGYIANEWPHLAYAHVMRVPFVDVLGGLSDPALPLAAAEYQEWGGNPAVSDAATASGTGAAAAAAKAFVAAYDPLRNAPGSTSASTAADLHRAAAAALASPHIMAVADTVDPRVPAASVATYIRSWRSAAEVARTALTHSGSSAIGTAAGGSSQPVAAHHVCKVTEHGHEGSADIFERFSDDGEQLAFLYAAMGLPLPAAAAASP